MLNICTGSHRRLKSRYTKKQFPFCLSCGRFVGFCQTRLDRSANGDKTAQRLQQNAAVIPSGLSRCPWFAGKFRKKRAFVLWNFAFADLRTVGINITLREEKERWILGDRVWISLLPSLVISARRRTGSDCLPPTAGETVSEKEPGGMTFGRSDCQVAV